MPQRGKRTPATWNLSPWAYSYISNPVFSRWGVKSAAILFCRNSPVVLVLPTTHTHAEYRRQKSIRALAGFLLINSPEVALARVLRSFRVSTYEKLLLLSKRRTKYISVADIFVRLNLAFSAFFHTAVLEAAKRHATCCFWQGTGLGLRFELGFCTSAGLCGPQICVFAPRNERGKSQKETLGPLMILAQKQGLVLTSLRHCFFFAWHSICKRDMLRRPRQHVGSACSPFSKARASV